VSSNSRLSALSSQNRRHLVAHFCAISGLFAEGLDRARTAATKWLCWQSEANPSLPAPINSTATIPIIHHTSFLLTSQLSPAVCYRPD
jgi:hypothetical protein